MALPCANHAARLAADDVNVATYYCQYYGHDQYSQHATAHAAHIFALTFDLELRLSLTILRDLYGHDLFMCQCQSVPKPKNRAVTEGRTGRTILPH